MSLGTRRNGSRVRCGANVLSASLRRIQISLFSVPRPFPRCTQWFGRFVLSEPTPCNKKNSWELLGDTRWSHPGSSSETNPSIWLRPDVSTSYLHRVALAASQAMTALIQSRGVELSKNVQVIGTGCVLTTLKRGEELFTVKCRSSARTRRRVEKGSKK